MRRLGPLALALVVTLAAAGGVAAAPPAASAPAAAEAPKGSLGPYASRLEGTWEFRSMKRPDGVTLAPPTATGVIVIDKGAVLAASYLQAAPTRQVGSLWEGTMTLTDDHFEVHPAKGVRYDSAATPVVTSLQPPPSSGSVALEQGGLMLRRADGGRIFFTNTGQRVQTDPDGTVIVHERTSLVPRVPDNLPGRKP